MPTISHLYNTYETATKVAQALESAGFSHEHVSIVANQGATGAVNQGVTSAATTGTTTTGSVGDTALEDTHADTGAGTGASVGTLLGGGAGLLAGIGALAIPGVGPVVAAGWLVATLTGAGAGAGLGGLVGALTGSGVKDEHAHVYAESVRRGDTLVSVRADDGMAGEAERIMQSYSPVDVTDREAGYRSNDGWTKFDESRGAMTAEEMQAERLRRSGSAI